MGRVVASNGHPLLFVGVHPFFWSRFTSQESNAFLSFLSCCSVTIAIAGFKTFYRSPRPAYRSPRPARDGLGSSGDVRRRSPLFPVLSPRHQAAPKPSESLKTFPPRRTARGRKFSVPRPRRRPKKKHSKDSTDREFRGSSPARRQRVQKPFSSSDRTPISQPIGP
jgi:hypothetical protein